MPKQEDRFSGALEKEMSAVALNVMAIAYTRIVIHRHMHLVSHFPNLIRFSSLLRFYNSFHFTYFVRGLHSRFGSGVLHCSIESAPEYVHNSLVQSHPRSHQLNVCLPL